MEKTKEKKVNKKIVYIISIVISILFFAWLLSENNKQDSINELESII